MNNRSKRIMWVLPLVLATLSAFSAWAPGGTAPDSYDLYVNNGTSSEFNLTYKDPTCDPPETTKIGKITASDHRAKFSDFATNGEESIEMTATNIANANDVRRILAKRRGKEYWVEIN